MKYIEEIESGRCFSYENQHYLATADFNRSKKRFCVNLITGQARWLAFDNAVQEISIYTIDEDNNFTPINPEPTNASTKNQDVR